MSTSSSAGCINSWGKYIFLNKDKFSFSSIKSLFLIEIRMQPPDITRLSPSYPSHVFSTPAQCSQSCKLPSHVPKTTWTVRVKEKHHEFLTSADCLPTEVHDEDVGVQSTQNIFLFTSVFTGVGCSKLSDRKTSWRAGRHRRIVGLFIPTTKTMGHRHFNNTYSTVCGVNGKPPFIGIHSDSTDTRTVLFSDRTVKSKQN